MNCRNACLINAVAGLRDDGTLAAFTGCDPATGRAIPGAGVGVPGLIYPLPFSLEIAAGATETLEVKPKNPNGAIPFAMRIFDDAATLAAPVVTIDQIRGPSGQPAGLKGDGISEDWNIDLFYGEAPMDALEAGLPNLPPDIGLIDASHSLAIDFSDATGGPGAPVSLRGVIYVVIPRVAK